MLIGVGVSCRIAYSVVSYSYVSFGGLIYLFGKRELFFLLSLTCKSNKCVLNRGWSNQNPNPALKTKQITNSQNTKITYGQPSKQLFPKRWSLSKPNRNKII